MYAFDKFANQILIISFICYGVRTFAPYKGKLSQSLPLENVTNYKYVYNVLIDQIEYFMLLYIQFITYIILNFVNSAVICFVLYMCGATVNITVGLHCLLISRIFKTSTNDGNMDHAVGARIPFHSNHILCGKGSNLFYKRHVSNIEIDKHQLSGLPAKFASKAIPTIQWVFLSAATMPAQLVPCLEKRKVIIFNFGV